MDQMDTTGIKPSVNDIKKWSTFTGGMVSILTKSNLGLNEYALLLNGRVRTDTVVPVRRPRRVAQAPNARRYQGFEAVDNFLVLVADGLIYYQDASNSEQNSFVLIPGVALNPDATKAYLAAVPPSSLNYVRKASTPNEAGTDIMLTTRIDGSVACLVAQDGQTQPIIILPNGTARQAQSFNQWNQDNREYVPIGQQMLWDGSVFYIASNFVIFRSVTGRPLDFIIPVDTNGNKISPESVGGAGAVSLAPVSERITGLKQLITGEILVSTSKYSFTLSKSANTFVFAEPIYNVKPLSTGLVNNECFAQILGDSTLIDTQSVKSFDAVQVLQRAAVFANFTRNISSLFVAQVNPACVSFATYGYYLVDTIYGRGILVYDEVLGKFVSLDLFDELTTATQLRVIDTGAGQKLFFITENALYEYGAGDFIEAQIDLSEVQVTDIKKQLVTTFINVIFENINSSGTVTVTPTVNGINLASKQAELVYASGDDRTQVKTFSYSLEHIRGSQLGLRISWNFDAELSTAQLTYDQPTQQIPLR